MKSRRYVIYEDHSGWVMTTLSDYELLQGIHLAMRATTWGEFVAALPGVERQRLLDEHPALLRPGSLSEPDAGEDEDGLSHRSDESFDPNDLPGFADGDYPPWPAEDSQISDEVCREVYRLYGKRETGFIHTFYHLHEHNLGAVQSWLESQGHALERRDSPAGPADNWNGGFDEDADDRECQDDAEPLEEGAEHCPVCRRRNNPGADDACEHYFGNYLDGDIIWATRFEVFAVAWSNLASVIEDAVGPDRQKDLSVGGNLKRTHPAAEI